MSKAFHASFPSAQAAARADAVAGDSPRDSKTPMTLVSAQTTGTNWLIQFPPARMSFRGRRQPPARFAWLYLHAALSGQPLVPPFRFEREPEGGWRLENTRSGETLKGFLAP